jgi:hypothetical protein
MLFILSGKAFLGYSLKIPTEIRCLEPRIKLGSSQPFGHAMSICAADTVEFSRGTDSGILVLHMALEFWWRKLCSNHAKSVFPSLAIFVDLHREFFLSLTPRAYHLVICVCSTSRSSAQPGSQVHGLVLEAEVGYFLFCFPVSYPPAIVDLRHPVQVCFNQALPCFSFFSSQ